MPKPRSKEDPRISTSCNRAKDIVTRESSSPRSSRTSSREESHKASELIPTPPGVSVARALKWQREVKAAEEMLRQVKRKAAFLPGLTEGHAFYIGAKDVNSAESAARLLAFSPGCGSPAGELPGAGVGLAADVKEKTLACESAVETSFLNSAEGRLSVARVTFRHVVVKRCIAGNCSSRKQHSQTTSINSSRRPQNELVHNPFLEGLEKKLLSLLPGAVVEAYNEEVYTMPLDIGDNGRPDARESPRHRRQHHGHQAQHKKLEHEGGQDTQQQSQRQQQVAEKPPKHSQGLIMHEEAERQHPDEVCDGQPENARQQRTEQQMQHDWFGFKCEPYKNIISDFAAHSSGEPGPPDSGAPQPTRGLERTTETNEALPAAEVAVQANRRRQKMANKWQGSISARTGRKPFNATPVTFHRECPGAIHAAVENAYVPDTQPDEAAAPPPITEALTEDKSASAAIYVKLETLEDLNYFNVQELERL